MRFSVKRVLAAFAVAACVAAPVMADSLTYSNGLSAGGAVATSPQVKKSSPTGSPAIMNFVAVANNDTRPLTGRVRTPAGTAATGTVSVYGPQNFSMSYYSGYGIYADYYVARIATHTQSLLGASFTVIFTP